MAYYYYYYFFGFCNIDYLPKFSSIYTTLHAVALAGVPAPAWGLQPRACMQTLKAHRMYTMTAKPPFILGH